MQVEQVQRKNNLSVAVAEFLKKFTPNVSSTLNPPGFPSDYLPKKKAEAEGETAAAVPEKLTLSFFLPHETTLDATKVQPLPTSRTIELLRVVQRSCMSPSKACAQPP